MAKNSFDIKSISRKIANSKKLNASLQKEAMQKLEVAKKQMIKEFREHPVSQEISAGTNAANISNTLSGSGNLFTFIGFPARAKPIESIVSLIQRKTFLIGRRGKDVRAGTGKTIAKRYQINYLDEAELNSSDEAKMPWESGSWVAGIEEGISSFSSYIYKHFEGGRSKKGGQAKKGAKSGGEEQKVRQATFSAVKYVSLIIENFKRNVRILR